MPDILGYYKKKELRYIEFTEEELCNSNNTFTQLYLKKVPYSYNTNNKNPKESIETIGGISYRKIDDFKFVQSQNGLNPLYIEAKIALKNYTSIYIYSFLIDILLSNQSQVRLSCFRYDFSGKVSSKYVNAHNKYEYVGIAQGYYAPMDFKLTNTQPNTPFVGRYEFSFSGDYLFINYLKIIY